MITGRQKLEALISDIQNSGADFRAKLGNLTEQRRKLAEENADEQNVVHAAIRSYLAATEKSQNDLMLAIEEATKKAKTLQQQVVEMQSSPSFVDLMNEASDKTAEDIEKTITYQSLLRNKEEIDQSYLACGSFEIEMAEFVKDLSLISNAQSKFNQMILAKEISKESRPHLGISVNAEQECDDALIELYSRAPARYKAGYAIGAALTAIGIALIAAALVIACPPAGALAIGLLAGGAVSTVGGIGTLFYTARVESKNPMVQIAVAMDDEEKRVKSSIG